MARDRFGATRLRITELRSRLESEFETDGEGEAEAVLQAAALTRAVQP